MKTLLTLIFFSCARLLLASTGCDVPAIWIPPGYHLLPVKMRLVTSAETAEADRYTREKLSEPGTNSIVALVNDGAQFSLNIAVSPVRGTNGSIHSYSVAAQASEDKNFTRAASAHSPVNEEQPVSWTVEAKSIREACDKVIAEFDAKFLAPERQRREAKKQNKK